MTGSTVYNAQGTSTYGTTYTYGPYNGTSGERMLKQIAMHNNRVKVQYDYDNFYRTSKKVLLNTGYALDTAYSWRPGTDSSHTSYMPSGQTETLKNASGTALSTKTLSYTYDSLGNIETISEGGMQRQKYSYDSLNQLIREDNRDLNKTIVYSYDLGGNLTSTAEYAYQTGATVTGTPTITNSYTYSDSNWKDKLTAYNSNIITYDQIGNPLSYHNGFTFTWQKGRQLASATNGTTSVSYSYNNDGYRTAKTVGGTTTDYTLEGSKVLIEKTGSDYVWFYYDAAGTPVAMATGSGPSLYIYRKNLQGDVTGIYSGSTGTLLVSYTYDAWSKVTATNVAGTTESATVLARNPYLYRGYRYDSETGLYYLNSRYYDPEAGRFINADGFLNQGSSFGNNLFVYCGNNPVNKDDPSGYSDRNAFCTYEDVRHGGLLFVKLAFVAVSAWMLLEQPVIYPAISKTKQNKVLAVAEAFLAKSKTKEYRSGTEIHHLVAKKASNAERAREVLNAVGIGLNDRENLVSIKTSLHRRLHTNLYYGIANSFVISAYQNAGNDKAAQKQAVYDALKGIETFVKYLNSNPIFW